MEYALQYSNTGNGKSGTNMEVSIGKFIELKFPLFMAMFDYPKAPTNLQTPFCQI